MNEFEVFPYKGTDSLNFGMTEVEVVAASSEPILKNINRRGEANWKYHGFSVRFAKSGSGLCEIGFPKESTVICNGIDLFRRADALDELMMLDKEIYEYYGFLVFFSLGMIFTGLHDGQEAEKAMTIFAKGRWDEFRAKPHFRKWEGR